jgi:hypothetical protein
MKKYITFFLLIFCLLCVNGFAGDKKSDKEAASRQKNADDRAAREQIRKQHEDAKEKDKRRQELIPDRFK